MPLERLNMVCPLYAVSLLLTGCTQFVEPLVLQGSPSTAREGMKQAPLLGNDPKRSPDRSPSTRARLDLVKSHAETRVDTQTSDNAVAVLETREAGQGVATSREVVEVANTDNSAVAFLTGPTEAHAMTGTEETPSVAWSGALVLALVATLLLYTRFFRRRAIQNTPTTPLVKLLHTRPWR